MNLIFPCQTGKFQEHHLVGGNYIRATASLRSSDNTDAQYSQMRVMKTLGAYRFSGAGISNKLLIFG